MPTLERTLDLPGVSREAIAAFHADPAVLELLSPPDKKVKVLEKPARMGEGAIVVIQATAFGVPLRWVSRIEGWDPPRGFADVQVKGPFSRWRHQHLFEEGRLVDRVDYEVPLAFLGGRLVERLLVRRDLERMFDHRHAVTKARLLGRPARG